VVASLPLPPESPAVAASPTSLTQRFEKHDSGALQVPFG
jgi:hypothetical protein